MAVIVYISIGNSDDKLTQSRWADYVQDASDAISDESFARHGEWHSLPSSPFQNACWCTELFEADADRLKVDLARIAAEYGQDSIAWAEAPKTEFVAGTQS